jgi:hypothetical protein
MAYDVHCQALNGAKSSVVEVRTEMQAQDFKFFRLLSVTAAASLGVSVTVGAFVVAATALLETMF